MKTTLNAKRKVRLSTEDKVFYTFSYILTSILIILVAYPIIYCFSASISSGRALMNGKVWLWPVDISFEGFEVILKDVDVWIGYKNTIFYTIVGTFINVVMTLLAAYPLSRVNLIGRRMIMFVFSFTMLFSGGMIPKYLLMKNLHLTDTVWAMLLPGAISVYNMVVARTFIQNTIPNELLESAKVDGCSDAKYFFKMVLPLSKSIIAVLSMWYAVSHWNAYFNAFLYLSKEELYPLQIFLRELLVSSRIQSDVLDPDAAEQILTLQYQMKYALIIVATVPLFVVYPFVQKHFVKGVMIGSVKG